MFCHFAKCQKISSNFLLFLMRGPGNIPQMHSVQYHHFLTRRTKGAQETIFTVVGGLHSLLLSSSSHFSRLLTSPPQSGQQLFSGLRVLCHHPPSKAKAALMGLFLETPLRKKVPHSPLQAQKRELPLSPGSQADSLLLPLACKAISTCRSRL